MSLPAGRSGEGVAVDSNGGIKNLEPANVPDYSGHPRSFQRLLSSTIVRNLWLGGALFLTGALVTLPAIWGVDTLIMRNVSGALSLIAGMVLGADLFSTLNRSYRRPSPLNFVANCGALTVCGAGILAWLVPSARDNAFATTLAVSPSITAGVVLVTQALIARVWSEADALLSLVPGSANEEKTLAEGELFTITPGIIVPTDGRIKAGSCTVLERYLSTDAHLRVKDEGDIVFAGSHVLTGEASLNALTASYESCLKRLEQSVLPGLRWVEDSLKREHDHIVTPLVYVLLFCFVSAGIFWDERGAAGATILLAAGSILTVGLLLQLGEVLYATRSRLVRAWAQRGFLINSAKAWSELYNVRTLAFDPSRLSPGTHCAVTELSLMDDRISERSLCSCIASIVGRAEDQALVAIGDYCQRIVGSVDTESVVDLREYPGRGICGTVKGTEFSIGSEDLVVERGILMQPADAWIESEGPERIVLVAIGDDVLARFRVTYGQADLISDAVQRRWPAGLSGRVLDSGERELSAETLLIRGDESDVVGRTHSPELASIQPNTLEVPAASLVSVTSNLDLLPSLVAECRRHVHEVLRARAWLLFGAFVSICLVFAGVVTPLISIGVVPVAAILIFI